LGWRDPKCGHIVVSVFFSRRPRTGRDRFLPVKLALLMVGGVLGLIGMRINSSLLVNIAIAAVLLGFLLRFVRQPGARGDAKDPLSPP
jgi:multisubunit Na+/H+ antiporter MnhF subunit